MAKRAIAHINPITKSAIAHWTQLLRVRSPKSNPSPKVRRRIARRRHRLHQPHHQKCDR
ncbi:hypothetical protein GXM_02341 [Nostoc sphaeroides CCNUC1]|uniref:Uncharacterized protein n=1 Tax=Nostoc sphaeroides CCNUC1 TaxID=2653204 RepID=A0A5P8VXK1_9NOSO|nr:hypothetical protein GXM_02341 [Nostoc sphaeroides CCNUC1]